MIQTTMGTVITRWVMISGANVPNMPSHWNSRNSGMRYDRPGVTRATRIRTAAFTAFVLAMP